MRFHAHMCVRAVYCMRRARMRELVLLAKCDITRTVYRMYAHTETQRHMKSPDVFNTGTDFPNYPLFSNRDDTIRVYAFALLRSDIPRS